MNLSEKILELLCEPKSRYKGISVNIFGLPTFKSYKKQSIRNSFSELKKDGYILIGEDNARVSNRGRKYIERKIDSLNQFYSPFKEDAPKDLIIMYDIPQERKAEREWFRFHLRKFNYEMIQKSVWVGPSPLPKEFINYVKSIHLGKAVKILKLAKSYKPETFQF